MKRLSGFKPDKSTAAISVAVCLTTLICSGALLHLSRARLPLFLYLVPLAAALLWNMYHLITRKPSALEAFESIQELSLEATPSARLQRLRELRDSGVIKEKEYQIRRCQVLEQL